MCKLVFSVFRDLHGIRKAVHATVNFIKSNYSNVSDNFIFEVKIILNELLSNSMRYSYRNDLNCIATVIVGITFDMKIYIVIKDYGDGFDYMKIFNKCEDIDLCIDSIKESGRGILLVKNLSDDIKFCNKGNKIVIIKKLITQCNMKNKINE
ncbi:MAG: ATP-binding protein [Clostridiales bacterium]